jgi:hypothetical protein
MENKFKTRIGNVRTKEYITWSNMMARCYSPSYRKNNPTYIGCTVNPAWHSFQVFAKWLTSQYGWELGWHLDKDLTILGNKIYSEEACSLIPRYVNNLFVGGNKGSLPRGVFYHKDKKAYVAQCQIGVGKQKEIGLFKDAESAFLAYKSVKEEYVKSLANEYKEVLPIAVYNNLMQYTVSITEELT